MRTLLWLVLRELTFRRGVLISLAVAASAVALCAGIELVSRSREAAVGAQIDRAAPPLRVTVSGLTATEMGRLDFGPRHLDRELVLRVRRALGSEVRTVEARLVTRIASAGGGIPVIGLEPGATTTFESLHALRDGQVAVGATVAQQQQLRAGERWRVGATTLEVVEVLPSAGDVEDLAAFTTLPTAQALAGGREAVTELRIYPVMGTNVVELAARLEGQFGETSVHRTDRGSVADRETGEALRSRRLVVYGLTGLAAGLFLLVGVHLRTTERRHELATLAAMGLSAGGLLMAVTLREVAVAVVGAVVGFGAACAMALVQDLESARAVLPAWPLLGIALLAAAAVSVLAACPAALVASRRDPAKVLKEA